MVYLVKASNDLISHCKCEYAPIGAPGQMDCPWCGCGWLFLCPKCRRAFTLCNAEFECKIQSIRACDIVKQRERRRRGLQHRSM